MLHRYIDKFFDYCRQADFSIRSVQALTARLNEFDTFLKKQCFRSIKNMVPYRSMVMPPFSLFIIILNDLQPMVTDQSLKLAAIQPHCFTGNPNGPSTDLARIYRSMVLEL